MNTLTPKSSKPNKPSSRSSTPLRSSSSLPSHFAMIELKQRIISSISKLSDRDTHQIGVEDLETIIKSLSSDGIPMLLNSLYEASNDPKPIVKKESLRLISLVCTSHGDSTSTHLPKIISHIVKRLKDSDSSVREACRDAIGVLSGQYLKGNGENGANLGSVVGLFVKPLFEIMGEQSKAVQSGAAMCIAKMVECAFGAPVATFQKLCPRICKYLNNPNFLAKAALLSVISSLSQVGAISFQSVPTLIQSIHDCLGNNDWATRKAAADTLHTLASHSSHLITDRTSSTITILEACRFDKVKPVRDSMTEALQLWKKMTDGPNSLSNGERGSQTTESPEKLTSNDGKQESAKEGPNIASPTSNSLSNAKGSSISDKTVGILKKRAPTLTDKELNAEFFQKLEIRSDDDLPVEVVVPRRFPNSSNSKSDKNLETDDTAYGGRSNDGNIELEARVSGRNIVEAGGSGWGNNPDERALSGKELKMKSCDVNGKIEVNQSDHSSADTGLPRNDSQVEGSYMNNKGNWLAIQRQLSQLERQQTHLMNMLQEFMGGSHDSMITLENRVRGLERVVEDMARDLAISSGRRASNFMVGYEGPSSRALGKYNNGLLDYSSTKLGRIGDARSPFAERFLSSDAIVPGVRGRDPPWKPDFSETLDPYYYGGSRNGYIGSRRGFGNLPSEGRPSRPGNDGEQVSSRRAWDKGSGPVRLGEGPSARSVWQASKDEATLEAIRGVAGEDSGPSRAPARVAVPEITGEAMGDDNTGRDHEQFYGTWRNAMDALHMGDIDAAYAEVMSTGHDNLLVKLMDRSGPVMDQLSTETACEVLRVIGQFLLEQNLFDIGLSWTQQLVDLVMENGPDVLGIPLQRKKELLLSLHEASSSSVVDSAQDWEGASPDQLMLQLASLWRIDLQHFDK